MSPAPHIPRISARFGAFALALAAACAFCAPAHAGTYGSTPVNISIGIGKTAPNGVSAEPAVSGDNRKVKIVAFSSLASNLVGGDRNGASDVFAWHRPGGSVPRQLGRGFLERVSVANSGREANGTSTTPSVDGSLENRPHCVAFQSTATDLSSKDALPDSDIYLRDLRSDRTILVSNGIAADAANVSVAGNCKKVVFEAGGRVWWSRVGTGKPRSLGAGSQPAYSRDGKSITYVNSAGRVVFRHGGLMKTLGSGSSPRVSDYSSVGGWAVAYNADGDVKLGLIDNGRARVQTAVRNAIVGGLTAKAAGRGIVVWANREGLFYLNRHTGNSDDLAYAQHPITQIDASARANLIAFQASGGEDFIDVAGNHTPSIYVKWLPK